MGVAETLPCLVVGAGATGLALAAQLRWFGCASASSIARSTARTNRVRSPYKPAHSKSSTA